MMKSEVFTFPRPGGEVQRVQLVRPETWAQLEFLPLSYDDGALECFAHIYRQYLVPAQPWIFGNMVMFRLPEGFVPNVPMRSSRYGVLSDPLTAAAVALKEGVSIHGGKPVFRDAHTKTLWQALQQENCIRIVSGKLPVTTIIPVGNMPGFLTKTEPNAKCKVNAPFFIMDRFDCATVYDHIGTPLGLRVKDGIVENPPLFGREALLVRRDGIVEITEPDIRDMALEIGGQRYRHGENCMIHTRPDRNRTPRSQKQQLIIVGDRVVAVKEGGSVPIPASGFVLSPTDSCGAKPGDAVIYRGMEDVVWGIQVGNSIVRNGVGTDRFISRFYNIRALERVPFPPSLYPLNFYRARAARIALGADAEGKPMLLWAEGAAKQGHVPGEDSCGATMADMVRICTELGMVYGIHLDGGGSAQILLQNRRQLKMSDRQLPDFDEAERPIPLGLIVR